MSVTMNTTQWNTAITQALEGTKLDGVDVTQASQGADGNLTITLTSSGGYTQSVTIPAPELDAIDANNDGVFTAEELDALQTKLEDSFAALESAIEEGERLMQSNSSPAGESQKVMFDIYSLMRLMLEIGKQQRETARHTRDAELQCAVADVMNRAEQIRSAAKTALIMSVVFSVASIAAQAVTMGMSAKAQGKTMDIEAGVGMKDAQQDLSLLSVKSGDESAANLTRLDKSLTPEQRQLAESYFDDSCRVRDGMAVDGDVTPQDYAAALDEGQNRLEASLGEKRLQLAQCEKNGGTMELGGQKVTSKQLKAEIKNLEAARQYGRAYVVNEKMQAGLQESLAADHTAAEAAFRQKADLLNLNSEYRAAGIAAKGWMTGGDIFRQTGEMLNSLTHQLNAMQQAGATEYEAAQKAHEAAREESNDLASSAQQLLQSVLDLLKSVQSAESQSIQRIMA